MHVAAAPTPQQLAAGIEAAWSRYLEREARGRTAPHPYVYASSWRPCDRRMVLEMTSSDQLPAWPAEVLAKFRRGDDRERDLLADLTRIGRDAEPSFRVLGQQERFTLNGRDGLGPVIVGKVDARLEVAGQRPPLEVKAWSPQLVERIETFADVFENPWTRSGGFQLLSYLYGAAEPFGFLLLDRAGLPALLPVELDAHLDRMEEFLTRAERAVGHARAGTLPDYLTGDAAECQRCAWFGHTCNPPTSGAGTQVLTDPELEAELERREQLKAAGEEFNRLDDRIKKRLRGTESAVAGHFQIAGKWGKYSRLELPADLKAQYTISDPKGRFTLDITRL